MIRRSFFSKNPANYPKSDAAYLIRKMAESYKDIPISEYEAEQKLQRDNRERRAAERIAALKPQKKAAVKKVKPLTKKKAA